MIEEWMGGLIEKWIERVIEGPGGLNVFIDREWVILHSPERIFVAAWIIRCLSNPYCARSAEVLAAIMERRRQLAREEEGR